MLNPGTFICINLVKDQLAMLHTKFQASEPSGSEEEYFLLFFFFVFLWFESRTPGAGPYGTLRPSFV